MESFSNLDGGAVPHRNGTDSQGLGHLGSEQKMMEDKPSEGVPGHGRMSEKVEPDIPKPASDTAEAASQKIEMLKQNQGDEVNIPVSNAPVPDVQPIKENKPETESVPNNERGTSNTSSLNAEAGGKANDAVQPSGVSGLKTADVDDELAQIRAELAATEPMQVEELPEETTQKAEDGKDQARDEPGTEETKEAAKAAESEPAPKEEKAEPEPATRMETEEVPTASAPSEKTSEAENGEKPVADTVEDGNQGLKAAEEKPTPKADDQAMEDAVEDKEDKPVAKVEDQKEEVAEENAQEKKSDQIANKEEARTEVDEKDKEPEEEPEQKDSEDKEREQKDGENKPSQKLDDKSETKADTKEMEDSGKEKEEKKKEADEDEKEAEDEEAEEEEEERVPLLERPPETSGRRQRRAVDRFSEGTPESRRSSLPLEPGSGAKLADCPVVIARIASMAPETVHVLHQIVFGRQGRPHEFRRNLRQFNGFPFEKDSAAHGKKREIMLRYRINVLRPLSQLLNLETKDKTREEMVENILDFLMEPKATDVEVEPMPKKRRSASNKKEADEDEDEEEGEDEDEESEEEEDEEEEEPAKKKARKAPAKRTPAKRTPAKRTPAKKTPAKKTPAKKTPAKKTPAKRGSSARKTPASSGRKRGRAAAAAESESEEEVAPTSAKRARTGRSRR